MSFSWKLGRVAGIDLYLHPTFLLLLLYVGTAEGGLPAMLLVAAVFGCVLLHELGHALAARLYGIATEDITLYPIGGVARLARMPRKPGPELVIALAGPVVNLAIAALLAVLMKLVLALSPSGGAEALIPAMLGLLLTYNLLLAGFNLIPAFPMDGGRVLRALLSGWVSRLRATEVAANIGRWLAIAFGSWSFLQGHLFQVALAVFVYVAASVELARVREEERPFDDNEPPAGYRWIDLGNGLWQLAPVMVTVDHPTRTRRSWP